MKHENSASQLSNKKRKLLAAMLEQRGIVQNSSGGIPARKELTPVISSYSQQSLWLMDKMIGSASTYTMCGMMTLQGKLDVNAWKESLNTLIERHEILRTGLIEENGTAYQHIVDRVDFPLQQFNLQNLSAEAINKELDFHRNQEINTPFDLSQAPLVRGRLLQINDNTYHFLLAMHHIVSDDWSLSIMHRELIALYSAYCQNRGNPLSPLPIQFGDYAAWQRERFTGERLGQLLAYWQKHLQDAPLLSSLPTDKPRPAKPSYRGNNAKMLITEELTAKLRTLAEQEKITLFTLLYAAWSMVLAKINGRDDIVLGVPVANRQRREFEDLIGFFMNSLALRSRVDSAQTVKTYLQQVNETILNGFSHQEAPFDLVVDELKPERTTSYSPLFQSMVVLHNAPVMNSEVSDLQITVEEMETGVARYDFICNFYEENNGLVVLLNYACDLFEQDTMSRCLTYLEATLEQMVSGINQTIGQIDIVPADERNDLLNNKDNIKANTQNSKHVYEIFAEQVIKTPHQIAIKFQDQQLTYAELNDRVEQLLQYLRAQNVQEGSLVGIRLAPSPESVISVMAVLKARATYVPIDPACPAARLNWIVEETALACLVTSKLLAESIQLSTEIKIILVDEPGQNKVSYQTGDLPVAKSFADENIVYVMYTSGSTGKPKGVEVLQQGLLNYLQHALINYFPAELEQAVVSSPLHFDATLTTLLSPLLKGLPIVLLDDENIIDDLVSIINQPQTSLFKLTPAHLEGIMQCMTSPCDTPHLLVVGGEAFNPQLLLKVQQYLPRATVINEYGPTETVVGCSIFRIKPGQSLSPVDNLTIPIGQAIHNTQLYVLDADKKLLPRQAIGELYIGGAGVARGYLNNQKLTSQCFIKNPFSENPNELLYKTGDLVRYRTDGNLEFVGRSDDQVKIRGFRIELGEIEQNLLSSHHITSSIVLAEEDDSGQKKLVAYVIPTGETELSESQLIQELACHLRERIPEYMLPSAFVVLTSWPLTSNGKVNRKALASLKSDTLVDDFIPPESDTEKTLTEIWAKLLKIDSKQIGVTANFLEIGGHSLLGIRMVGEIRRQFAKELPINVVFTASNIRSIAKLINASNEDNARSAITKAPRNGDSLPLSFGQKRLLFVDRINGGSPGYNMPGAMHVSGKFDIVAAEIAVKRIIERHESLRTVFVENETGLGQVVKDGFEFAISIIDLRNENQETQIEKARQIAEQESWRVFDLSADLMFRTSFIHLSDANGVEQGILLFNVHHIASDGWSMGVLSREFMQQYLSLLNNEPDPLPELPIQYSDYAYWQQEWLSTAKLKQQNDYWSKQLENVPAVHSLALDYSRPELKGYAGDFVRGKVSYSVGERLKKIAVKNEVTLFMLLHAALSLVISRNSNNHDVIIGTPLANRTRAELEPLIGFFVNTLVIRTNTDYELFSEYLAHVKKVILEAQENQDLPFEKLVEISGVPRSNQYTPLYQIQFNMNTTERIELSLPGLEFSPFEVNDAQAKFDLEFLAVVNDEGIDLNWLYDTSLFAAETIAGINDHMERLLNSLADSMTDKIVELPILSTQEIHYLTRQLNSKVADYEIELLIHEFFEKQVARTPDSIAIVHGKESLTFDQLNRKSNQLAHYLRRQGVVPDSLVGLCITRSIDMMVAILGVLKAGAAYVPLDPEYPSERLGWMVEDAQPTLIITETKLTSLFKDIKPSIFELDLQRSLLMSEATTNLDRASRQNSRHLAYVIFTSGSTGRPKGVAVEHRSVATLLSWIKETFQDEHRKGVLAAASICFDLSVFEIYHSLSWGGKLIIADSILDISSGVPSEHEITFMSTVPSVLAELVRVGGIPKTVKVIGLSGEQLTNTLAQRVYQEGVEYIYNLYGPSEDTVFTTYELVPKGSDEAVCIGRPIANKRIYILDKHLQLVPKGVAGELYIAGDGLAREYYNKPDLTKERFLKDPFSDNPLDKMYKTGDLVRYQENDKVEYLGRLDHQVKINGFRIELGEIESAILAHPHISQTVVIAYDDEVRGKILIAYTVKKPNISLVSEQVLKNFIRNRLPVYMVPGMFISLDSLPLSSNGKLIREALPHPFVDLERRNSGEEPKGEIENIVAKIWRELFELNFVDRRSNFFELGGHSLLSIEFFARLRVELGIDVSIKTLFEYPVLQDFCNVIAGISISQSIDNIDPVARLGYLPVSFNQEELWYLHQVGAAEAINNLTVSLHIKGELNLSCLNNSFTALVARHEGLRTTFHFNDGKTLQRIGAPKPVVIPQYTVSLAERIELKEKLANEPFNLEKDNLFRVALFSESANENELFITIHHIVSDFKSLEVFLRDFKELYLSSLEKRPAALPELIIQYADYAAYQRNEISKNKMEHDLAYWQHKMTPLPEPLRLPFDYERPKIRAFQGCSAQPIIIDKKQLQQIKSICSDNSATHFMFVNTLLSLLLYRQSHQADLTIYSPVNTRSFLELESVIGFFINTLALRLNVSINTSFEKLLQQVKESTIEAYAHKEVPFNRVLDSLPRRADSQKTPLFQVWSNYLIEAESESHLGDLQLALEFDETSYAKHDLMLVAAEREQQLTLTLTYNSELFTPKTIDGILIELQMLLTLILERPQSKVAELLEKTDKYIKAEVAAEAGSFNALNKQQFKQLKSKRRNNKIKMENECGAHDN